MRIISGRYKGKKIYAPKNLPVRPTTDRAKEAIFSKLSTYYNLNEVTVLDLFSGTGNISYEFASRGCKNISSVDINNKCINFIKKTSSELNCSIKYFKMDSIKFVMTTKDKYDIIFADPPFNYKEYHKLSKGILSSKILNENGILIIEHSDKTKFDEELYDKRKYGDIHLSIFNKNILK